MQPKKKYEIRTSEAALKDLKRLDQATSSRILKKIRFFSEQESPLVFSERLSGLNHRYRWRVGKWRIIFEKDEKTNQLVILLILVVRKRDKAYQELR